MTAAALLDIQRVRAIAEAPPATPLPLPADLLPVTPFPLDALPDRFRPWVSDVTERMRCPSDFVAVPLLVAAASLVSRHVAIRPQQRTPWTERANLWAMLVGRPGWMKTPAMAEALRPMHRLEARAAAEFEATLEAYQVQAMLAKLKREAAQGMAKKLLRENRGADVVALLQDDAEPAAPVRKRYVIADATYAKLGELLRDNPGGVLSVRDELRGLLASLAGEDAVEARAFYLSAWSGGPYVFDRIERGTIAIEDARLSIIGGIQPGPLTALVAEARRGTSDDGMLERFLVAWPDDPGEWRNVDRWPDTDAKTQVWAAFEQLDLLTAVGLDAQVDTDPTGEARGIPYLRFTPEGIEAFVEWRTELERTKLRQAESPGLESALSKFRHHVPALALTLHVTDSGRGPVTLAATLRALELADYFESQARRLHGSGRSACIRAARAILAKARAAALPDPFTARDVYRHQWAGLSDRRTVAEALDLLAGHEWLTEGRLGGGDAGGRPTTTYSLAPGARHG